MKRYVAALAVVALVGGFFASAVMASDPVPPAPPAEDPGLADQLHQDADQVGGMAANAGHLALHNAGQAVIYMGKAIINGCEFIVLKTTQGVILVTEAMVRGIEFAVEGAKFIALKTKQGLVWVCEKAILAGEIMIDVICDVIELTIDGVTYVAVQLAEGITFLAKEAYEAAVKVGELIVKGVTFVIKQTVDGIVWVAKKTTQAVRRAALVAELRMNITGALATAGVGNRTMEYFRSRSMDNDPVIARLGKACLAAAETFNTTYY